MAPGETVGTQGRDVSILPPIRFLVHPADTGSHPLAEVDGCSYPGSLCRLVEEDISKHRAHDAPYLADCAQCCRQGSEDCFQPCLDGHVTQAGKARTGLPHTRAGEDFLTGDERTSA